MRKNLNIDSKKRQNTSSDQGIQARGRKNRVIKNIHQLISCAPQDKEKHRNPEKEKKNSKTAFQG